MVRWLGGEYTNRHRDWARVFQDILARPAIPAPASFPPPDFHRAYRVFTEGVPLCGNYVGNQDELAERQRYDNHPAIGKNSVQVEKKFAGEEGKSFHLILPRFLVSFLPGLFLSPLQWEVRKGKGRICVDCTNGPHPSSGAPNSFIPKPSAINADACPPVYYSDALQRHLVRLWRMRMTRPEEDILQHCDDLDSAFRRILYHPDLALVFAYVFTDFLIIPVGQVFGSRSAPSYFSLTSDIRAYVATTRDLTSDRPLAALAAAAQVQPLPAQWSPSLLLAPALADTAHSPLSQLEQSTDGHSTFVDDNGVVAFRSNIRRALHQSIESAYMLYGYPAEDRRDSCISAEKWIVDVTPKMEYLGLIIDSRALTVTWPLTKRLQLRSEIQELLARGKGRSAAKPKELASVLGKLRSASRLAPWGHYISWSIQLALTTAARAARNKPAHFWRYGSIRLLKDVRSDLREVVRYLNEPEFSPTWTRLIALLVHRAATLTCLSDASYGGIGGWFHAPVSWMWRLVYDDLVRFKFDMKPIDKASEPRDPNDVGLHINPLEFIGTIINLWLAIKWAQRNPSCPTGHILALFADNTSAVSWLHFTAITPNSKYRHLARVASALLVAAANLTMRVQPQHIAGLKNGEADCLSRLKNGRNVPSWDAVIAECSQLGMCHICLLPSKLLTILASLISSEPIVATYEQVTTELLTLDVVILPLGLRPSTLTSTLQD